MFWKDLIWLPRTISLLFGILTIASAALLADELFGKKEITLYTILIALLMPQRVLLSIVPLPEIIFFFFIISAAFFFLKYQRTNNYTQLVFTALFLTAANALRYEGWLLTITLIVFVLYRYRIKLAAFPVIPVLASFPLFWLVFNYLKYDDIFHFIKEPENYYAIAQEQNLGNTLKFNPITQFIEQNLITLNMVGLGGMYLLRRNETVIRWLVVFYIPLLFISVISLTGLSLPAHNFWRTSAAWTMLMIPFTSYVLFKLKKAVVRHPSAIFILIFLPLQLVNSNFYYIRNIKSEYCLTNDKVETAAKIMNFFNASAKGDEHILIENLASFEHFDIALASQEPFKFVYSERDLLAPIDRNEYRGVKISYYLVKSERLKSKLDNPGYLKVLETDGWQLYKKRVSITEIRVR